MAHDTHNYFENSPTGSDDTRSSENPSGNLQAEAGQAQAAQAEAAQAQASRANATAECVAFCQDCGRPLTTATVRAVGSGIFCEPCLVRRVGGPAASASGPAGQYAGGPYAGEQYSGTYQTYGGAQGQAGPASGTDVPPSGFTGAGFPPAGAAAADVPSHLPNPTLAGFLGLIPGVGAMYNGQFAKGIAHLVIFFILSSLSDHVSGGFGILVAGWVFYQAFEAYHTAKARLLGTPLPNPLGLNDIGDRMGFGTTWAPRQTPSGYQTGYRTPPAGQPTGATATSTSWTPTAWTPAGATDRTAATAAGTATATAFEAASAEEATVIPGVTPDPPATSAWTGTSVNPAATAVPPVPPANWAGYVPPGTFAQAAHSVGFQPAPYAAAANPYAPVSGPGVGNIPVAAPLPAGGSRFPIAAVALIALGVLALLQTTFRIDINGSWIAAFALAVAAIAQMAIRLSRLHRNHPEGVSGARVTACALNGPALMFAVLAVLFALQAANRYTLGQTWAVIVIAFGAIMLAQRAAERAAAAADANTVAAHYTATSYVSVSNPHAVTPQPNAAAGVEDEAGRL